MKFTKYNSLTNHTNQKFQQYALIQGLTDGLFVGTEKAHGANFSFYCNNTGFRQAKRSGFCDETFYNCKEIIERYQTRIEKLFEHLVKTFVIGFEDSIEVYGEIIGGKYDGQKTDNAKTVQKEVQYCPNNEFIAFDIYTTTEAGRTPMSYEDFKGYCDTFEIPTCPEVVAGTLEECLAADNEFNSRIPAVFGRKNLMDNICEGFVIRPVEGERWLANGDRLIIKSKNSKFSEKGKSQKVKQRSNTLTELDKVTGETLTKYFTENRFNNVVSKEGEITSWKDFPKYSGLFFQDAVEEFDSGAEVTIKDSIGDNWKAFIGVYKLHSDSLVREWFKAVL